MAEKKKDNKKFVWQKGDVEVTKIVYLGKVFDHVPTEAEKQALRDKQKQRK